jgi:NitT/TauT family transport system substrate-binding protein
MGKTAKLVGLVAVGALLTAACGGSGTSGTSGSPGGSSLTKVSLRLDWFYGSEHAAYFVAQDKGFFKKAGLDVDIREGNGSSTALKLVANGSNTFGIVGAGTVLTGASQNVPVEAIAAIFQETPGAICYDTRHPISTLKDMYGGKLADDPGSVSHNEWLAVAALNGVDTTKIADVAIKPGSDAQVMLTGKVNYDNCWTINQGVEMQRKDFPVGYLTFPDLGLHIPGSSLVTNRETIAKNPAMVRAFVQAVIEGWNYSIAHPDEALSILLDHQPHIDENYNKVKMPLVLDLVRSAQGVGYMDPAKWASLEKLYLDGKVITNNVDINTVFTNKFVSAP